MSHPSLSHRTSANRELASIVLPSRTIVRSTYRKVDRRALTLSVVTYFAAIGVIGWFVITQGRMVDTPSRTETIDVLARNGSAPGRVLAHALEGEGQGASLSAKGANGAKTQEYLGQAPDTAANSEFWADTGAAPKMARWSMHSKHHF